MILLKIHMSLLEMHLIVEPVEQAAAGVVPGPVMGEVKKRQVSLAQCWAK